MSENIYNSPEANLDAGQEVAYTPTLTQLLFSFKGRALRKHYWFTFLGAYVVFFLAATLVGGAIGSGASIENAASLLLVVLYIPFIWILLAIQAKRWHDRDKSAWWILIGLIPLIGPIWALVENGFLQGTEGENRFGAPCA